MEKETRVLLWGLFAIVVMTAGFMPVTWTITERAADQGVVVNATLAKALWGQQVPVAPAVLAPTQYPQASAVAIIPGALHPQLTAVKWNTAVFAPQLTIEGSGFGNPGTSNQEVLTLTDESRGWQTSNTASTVLTHILSWTNNEIVVDRFVGYGSGDPRDLANGLGSFVFAPGDQIGVSVTNPQTGLVGTAQTQFDRNAPMPTVTLYTSPRIVQAGHVVTLSGSVTFAGKPLANQAVRVSVVSGRLTSPEGIQVTPTDFMIDTDTNGHFRATWTAPDTAGPEEMVVMADSVIKKAGVQVITPPWLQSLVFNATTWPPQLTIVGQHLGSDFSPDDVTFEDTTRQWGSQDLTYTLSPTSGETAIEITGMDPYGGDHGRWLFAPGDAVTVMVRNPQTGLSGTLVTTYPRTAAIPLVFLSSPSSLGAGASEVISGQVTFDGVGLADQTVHLRASEGEISGMTGPDTSVITNASGDFTATYTAPGTGGLQTLTATCDGSTRTKSVPVQGFTVTLVALFDQTDNRVLLIATVNEPLHGYLLRMVDQTTGQTLAQTNQGTTLKVQIMAQADVANTYIVTIG